MHVLARKGWQVRASPAREDLLPGKGRRQEEAGRVVVLGSAIWAGTGRLMSSPGAEGDSVLFQNVPSRVPARTIWNSQVMGI